MFARTGPTYKYNRRTINNRTRDFWGTDECCRRSRDQMYCKCPTELHGLQPIISGEYIWYILDKDLGFINDKDNNRLIYDNGTSTIKSNKYNGHMYSGVILSLGTDAYVDVPVSNITDTVAFYDGNSRTFKQISNTSNASFIRLSSGLYGPIIKLIDNTFTQYDLDNFTMFPENVLRWKFHEDVGISLPVKYEYEVYACIEGEGSVLHEVHYNQHNSRQLTITGAYSWNINTTYGLQKMRLDLVDIV